MIPLTKTLHAEDYLILERELRIVDRFFEKEAEQHPQRRWEYAMALRAARTWGKTHTRRLAIDVGGSGSPLRHMLAEAGFSCIVVDPKESVSLAEAYVTKIASDFVTCVSVIEHVQDILCFVNDLARVVRPSGALFLTTDIWDPPVESTRDAAHFHWMRERIFTPKTWQMLAEEFRTKGFSYLGEQDWEYHGNQVYDYSFASVALVKE